MAIYQLALENDIEFKVAESAYLFAAESLPLAQSGWLPQISLRAQNTYKDSHRSPENIFNTNPGVDQNYGYSLHLSQNIYSATVIAEIDIAKVNVIKAKAELEGSRQNLVLRTAERYFDILRAQDNVEFADAEKTAISRQLEQAQKQFEVGLMTIIDVQEARARYDSAVAAGLLAENQLKNAHQALQVMITQAPPDNLARLNEDFEPKLPDPADSLQWVDLALQNNHSLAAALANLRIKDYTRNQLASGQYPTIDLKANYSDTRRQAYDQTEASLSIELNLPLYTGGRISAQKQQAESNYQSAQNTVLLQKRLITEQVQNAYLGVVFGISQVKALQQALHSSTTALEATKTGFEVGTRTSVEVLTAVRSTYSALRDHADARYRYLINILKLKQAAGILSAEDLTQINQWLQTPTSL